MSPVDRHFLPQLQVQKCPCGHPTCTSGNLQPITYGQGVMPISEAEEIARRCNLFPRMLLALRKVKDLTPYKTQQLNIEQLVAEAEGVG